jgi:hypothetical protein
VEVLEEQENPALASKALLRKQLPIMRGRALMTLLLSEATLLNTVCTEDLFSIRI